jgi:acetyl-CoA carboxylase biotin carboxylase subunit
VRLDTHVYAGYRIPPYYDSLMAKLIVSAKTRQEALVRSKYALGSFVIEGVSTTIPFLLEVVSHSDFQKGEVDTHFVERILAERVHT